MQVAKIKKNLSLLPVPEDFAGIEIKKVLHRSNSIEASGTKVMLGGCPNYNYVFKRLIKLLTVETTQSITDAQIFSKQREKFFNLPFIEAEQILIKSLEIALSETQTRLDFLNEEIEEI